MWYFSWALGLGLACSFAILNAMWLELTTRYEIDATAPAADPPRIDQGD